MSRSREAAPIALPAPMSAEQIQAFCEELRRRPLGTAFTVKYRWKRSEFDEELLLGLSGTSREIEGDTIWTRFSEQQNPQSPEEVLSAFPKDGCTYTQLLFKPDRTAATATAVAAAEDRQRHIARDPPTISDSTPAPPSRQAAPRNIFSNAVPQRPRTQSWAFMPIYTAARGGVGPDRRPPTDTEIVEGRATRESIGANLFDTAAEALLGCPFLDDLQWDSPTHIAAAEQERAIASVANNADIQRLIEVVSAKRTKPNVFSVGATTAPMLTSTTIPQIGTRRPREEAFISSSSSSDSDSDADSNTSTSTNVDRRKSSGHRISTASTKIGGFDEPKSAAATDARWFVPHLYVELSKTESVHTVTQSFKADLKAWRDSTKLNTSDAGELMITSLVDTFCTWLTVVCQRPPAPARPNPISDQQWAVGRGIITSIAAQVALVKNGSKGVAKFFDEILDQRDKGRCFIQRALGHVKVQKRTPDAKAGGNTNTSTAATTQKPAPKESAAPRRDSGRGIPGQPTTLAPTGAPTPTGAPQSEKKNLKRHLKIKITMGRRTKQRGNTTKVSGQEVWEDGVYLNYTKGWRRLLTRMAPIANLPTHQQRYKTFTTHHGEHSATTQATYWTAVLAVMKIGDKPTSHGDKHVARVLASRAKAEERRHVALPMRDRHFRRCWSMAIRQHKARHSGPNIPLLVCLSYILGQRPSDMTQLHRRDITRQLRHRLAGTAQTRYTNTPETICLTVRRGKVVPKIGPYSLHLSTENAVAKLLWSTRKTTRSFIFSSNNSRTERRKIATSIRTLMQTLSRKLQSRSIRRGGLTRMAEAGMPLETIRANFSKHATEPMLMGYLAAGAVSAHQAQQQTDALEWVNAVLRC